LRLLVFDLCGYMGYFRKFYSSSKPLSYTFPPRTTIIGLVSGILGYDKDSYYSDFSDENCKVALALKHPVRKISQSLNYLDTDDVSVRRLRGIGTVPTTSEFVVPEPPSSRLRFRIYLNHKNEDITEELKMRIQSKRFRYPPSLGSANLIADVEYVGDIDASLFSADGGRKFEILGIIPKKVIASLIPKEGQKIYLEEAVPADFSEGREIRRIEDYVFEGEGNPLFVTLNLAREIGFRLKKDDDYVFGVFM